MALERYLQINVVLLAILATTLLGMGQQNWWMPILAVVIGLTSFYVTDLKQKLSLNRHVANGAAIVAVIISTGQFFQLEKDSQLLAIANLLVYLQIVLLFQRKDTRVFWQLFMLSFLQVVVACALNFDLKFGFLLVLYLFGGLLALSLFFSYREMQRYAPEIPNEDDEPEESTLTTTQPRFSNHARPRLIAAATGRDLWRGVYGQVVMTLALTVVVFFVFPRFSENAWRETRVVDRMVGFSETVTLGELGEAFQNPQPVMRVWLTRAKNGEPLRLAQAPWFRGSVVNEYINGSWRHVANPRHSGSQTLPLMNWAGNSVVNQRIHFDPLEELTVFSIYPPYRVHSGFDDILYSTSNQQLVRRKSRSVMECTLATTGIAENRQLAITPLGSRLSRFELDLISRRPDETGKEGVERFAGLKQLAADVLEERSDLAADDAVGRARALESYLRDSGEFEYTLSAPAGRDYSIDPIEDFVVNTRVGHCEYFSSALTLMLRSQDIPARMVIGFRGAEYNQLGKYYQVRQLHAHSWVEAYISPKQARQSDISAPLPSGGWLRLDPTTSLVADGGASNELTLAAQMRQWANYGEYLWAEYVVGLDSQRQVESIYAPLWGEIKGYGVALVTPETYTEQLPQFFGQFFKRETWRNLMQNLLSWRGVLVTGLFFLSLLIAYRLLRPVVRWVWSRLPGRQKASRRRSARVVPFYDRLEKLLSRHGWQREEGQTQREFADLLALQFSQNPALAPVADLPASVVRKFYQIRYSRQAIEDPIAAQMDEAVRSIAQALAERSQADSTT